MELALRCSVSSYVSGKVINWKARTNYTIFFHRSDVRRKKAHVSYVTQRFFLSYFFAQALNITTELYNWQLFPVLSIYAKPHITDFSLRSQWTTQLLAWRGNGAKRSMEWWEFFIILKKRSRRHSLLASIANLNPFQSATSSVTCRSIQRNFNHNQWSSRAFSVTHFIMWVRCSHNQF